MTITAEELAAYADGELTGAAKERIAAAIAADASLARQLEAHRALKARLAGHFAPVLDQPLPDRLTQMLSRSAGPEGQDVGGNVVGIAAARAQRESRRRLPAWGWGGAIAASVAAVALFSFNSRDVAQGYAGGEIARMLDEQLIASQPGDAEARVVLSFRNGAGEYCRAFNVAKGGGIACRDATGWRLEAIGDGEVRDKSDYRMAGSDAQILAIAQEMAAGEALNADEEAAARQAGWRE